MNALMKVHRKWRENGFVLKILSETYWFCTNVPCFITIASILLSKFIDKRKAISTEELLLFDRVCLPDAVN